MVKKGTFVSAKAIILEADARAENIPKDTQSVPLVAWIFGELLGDANIGDQVSIKTPTGRIEYGILEEIEPIINVDYGSFVLELKGIGGDYGTNL